MRRILAVALLVVFNLAWATAQLPEVLIMGGKPVALHIEPLFPLLKQRDIFKSLRAQVSPGMCSANWRGYQGTWEIRDDALYLTKLSSSPC